MRKDWRVALILFFIPLSLWGDDKPLTDDGVRDLIIAGDISSYEGDCPCPYSIDRNKNRCGNNSAYSVYPGRIKCYPGDISKAEVKLYRAANRIEAPRLPWEKEKRPGF